MKTLTWKTPTGESIIIRVGKDGISINNPELYTRCFKSFGIPWPPEMCGGVWGTL